MKVYFYKSTVCIKILIVKNNIEDTNLLFAYLKTMFTLNEGFK
jgi:hypothetical protein